MMQHRVRRAGNTWQHEHTTQEYTDISFHVQVMNTCYKLQDELLMGAVTSGVPSVYSGRSVCVRRAGNSHKSGNR